eukprot:GHVT01032892.1.p3 GENE.GHVT01032892.1~~GHVT01032892.1.p3  ORF type:complete len:111 (-),score=32.28 GHVT01032892.1:1893-2225(-)
MVEVKAEAADIAEEVEAATVEDKAAMEEEETTEVPVVVVAAVVTPAVEEAVTPDTVEEAAAVEDTAAEEDTEPVALGALPLSSLKDDLRRSGRWNKLKYWTATGWLPLVV